MYAPPLSSHSQFWEVHELILNLLRIVCYSLKGYQIIIFLVKYWIIEHPSILALMTEVYDLSPKPLN